MCGGRGHVVNLKLLWKINTTKNVQNDLKQWIPKVYTKVAHDQIFKIYWYRISVLHKYNYYKLKINPSKKC